MTGFPVDLTPDWYKAALFAAMNEFKWKERPTPLSHYTDATALKGIAEDGVIWATDLRYVNDASELQEYRKVCLAQIAAIKAQAGPATKFIERIERAVQGFDQPVYAVSFTEHADNLGQWRGYCEAGKGYSVGFDLDQLYMIGGKQSLYVLTKCHYSPNIHAQITRMMLLAVIENFNTIVTLTQSHPTFENDLGTEILNFFAFIAPLLKDASFSEESEWRIVARANVGGPNLEPSYRVRSNALVPYVSIPLTDGTNKINATQVIVGPCHNQSLQREAVTGLASKDTILFGAKVKSSKIPYQLG